MSKSLRIFLLIAITLSSFISYANEPELPTKISDLRIELDRINFDIKDPEILKERLKLMITHTTSLVEKKPRDPALLMMAGYYNIQYAGALGNMSALKYAKAARDQLTSSIEIDPSLFSASAHSSLGRIYMLVPGWPIAFGNKKKGLAHLKKAIEIAPKGMESNFTYGEHLYEKKKFDEAKKYLLKAQVAQGRPNRERADEKLQKYITEHLLDIEKQQS